jgi:glutathione S-transferase
MSLLYVSDLSPFGARIRLVLDMTGQSVAMQPPPGGSGSPEMKALAPFGKIPAFRTGARMLVESAALMEYFAEKSPDARLICADPEARAAMRGVIQTFDHEVLTALVPTLALLRARPPDAAAVRAGLDETAARLDRLALLLDPGDFAVGDRPSLADCAMVPFALVTARVAPMVGAAPPFDRQPRWARWQARLRALPEVERLAAFMAEAFAKLAAPRPAGA